MSLPDDHTSHPIPYPVPFVQPPPSLTEAPIVLTCRTPADLLAALPRLTGFTAEDSLFLLLFHGARVQCAMRVDLPASIWPGDWGPLIDHVGDVALRARFSEPAERASPAIVITTSQSFSDTGDAPWRGLATAIMRRLRRDGVPAREACCRAADGWASYLTESTPVASRPLSEIQASPVSCAAEGISEPPPLSELAAIPEPTSQVATAVRLALEADAASDPVSDLAQGFRFDPRPDQELHDGASVDITRTRRVLRWVLETTSVARDLSAERGGSGIAANSVARLGLRVGATDGWFVIALALITRTRYPAELAVEHGPHAVLGLTLDPPSGAPDLGPPFASLHGFLQWSEGADLDHAKLARARSRILVACGALPTELRAGPLALAAWLWWRTGVHSVSCRLLEHAARISPSNSLVDLVARATEAPVVPFELAESEARTA